MSGADESGFDELVARTRRELASLPEPTRPGGAAELERHLLELERNVEPFGLRVGSSASPLKRALGGLVRALGLGKHLGANQARANRATLAALRALEQRVRELEQGRRAP